MKAVELVLAKVKAVASTCVRIFGSRCVCDQGLRAKDGGLEAKDRWSRHSVKWASCTDCTAQRRAITALQSISSKDFMLQRATSSL